MTARLDPQREEAIRRLEAVRAARAENIGDTQRHGRTTRGERSGTAKLKLRDALYIRQSKGSNRSLARRFGVSPAQVSRIKNGKRWPELDPPPGFDPHAPIEDLAEHFAECHRMKVPSP